MDWSGFRPPSSWRNSGAEWSGPCPVSGAGRTKSWAVPDSDLIGCREHGGRLDGEALREHAAALGVAMVGAGAPARVRSAPAGVAPVKRRGDGGAAAGALWLVSGPVPEVGLGYLIGRGAWSAPGALPGSVRWADSGAYCSVPGAYPGLPVEAAGVLVYRFMAPDEGTVAAAVQVEAVDLGGRRVEFVRADGAAMKRPALAGAEFDGGRRVFVGRWPVDPAEVWIVEGPLDALAMADYCRRHRPAAAVLGVPGTSGFRVAAAEAAPAEALIVIGADADGPGRAAAARLGAELERAGRRWEVRTAPGVGADWCDWSIESAEREAVLDG